LEASGSFIQSLAAALCEETVDPYHSSSPLPISSPAGPALPTEQIVGTGLELHLSSITLIEQTGDNRERPSSVWVLTQLASGARLFRSADGHFCAQIPVGDRFEIYGLRSAGFRDWPIDGYMDGQTDSPRGRDARGQVFLHLTAIPDTQLQSEGTFWSADRADYPRILGAVLDAIVGGLRELPSVKLTELPRMADYAE
jgi:hypothetical protein